MARTIDCDTCGMNDAVLTFFGERLCRDCFAGQVALCIMRELPDDADWDTEAEDAMARGYEDADCLLNGGRLPY